jgi:hypothetical protein
MVNNINQKSEKKNVRTMQSKRIIAFVITLVVAQALKSQVMPSLQGKSLADVFNKDWQISFGGLVLGYVINMFVTSKLVNYVLLSAPYDSDKYDYTTGDVDKDGTVVTDRTNRADKTHHGTRQLGGVLIKDIIETIVLLGTQVIFTATVAGKRPELTPAVARNVLLAVFGIILSDIIVEPLIHHNIEDAQWAATASEVTKRTLSIAAVDYLADLSIDNMVTEAGTTAAGIFVGELSSTPVANALADQLRPDGIDKGAATGTDGWGEIPKE